MSELVGKCLLKGVPPDDIVDAFLYEGIEERHLEDLEQHWKPVFLEKSEEKKSNPSLISSLHLEDLQWHWPSKISDIDGQLSYRTFSIECGSITQGLMIINISSKRCRIEEQRNQHLAYIEYLATAPWNRKPLMAPEPARYRGVGKNMIATAIQVSHEEGFNGRIGLHALPQAENYYGGYSGMADLGIDGDCQNLRYFEMTPELAKDFLG